MADDLAGTWQRTLRRSPAAPAVVDAAAARRWSRAELEAAAAGIRAMHFAGRDLAGRCVLLAGANGAGWLAMFLALLQVGAVPAAVDATEPEAGQVATAEALGAVAIWRGGPLLHWCGTGRRRRRHRRDVALLKLTSGSTGVPRALPFTHRSMIADGRHICSTMGIRPRDVNLGVVPLGHSYGLGNLVVPLLTQGTAVVCAAGALPHMIAQDCAAWRPTVFPAVPALLRALVLAEVDPAALRSLRLVISAGAPLDPEVARAFRRRFGCRVHGFYGTSETGGISYDRSGAATEAGRSVGRPLRGVQVEFRRGGRLVVCSEAVMARGRHAPADRAGRNAAGELVLRGRTGRVVKIAGRRVDPGEVESVLRGLPGVQQACVIAHPEKPDALAALVAGDIAPATVRRSLGGRIARWKIPDRVKVVPELPLTARGKTDRAAVRALLGAGRAV